VMYTAQTSTVGLRCKFPSVLVEIVIDPISQPVYLRREPTLLLPSLPIHFSSFRSIQIPSDPGTREAPHLSVKGVLTMVTRCPQIRRLNSPSLRKDPANPPSTSPARCRQPGCQAALNTAHNIALKIGLTPLCPFLSRGDTPREGRRHPTPDFDNYGGKDRQQ
jgi:hypothetical protein